MIFCHKIKNIIFVAKTRSYDIFFAEIYDYVLIDSFRGSAGFLDSPTSYVTLVNTKFAQKNLPVATNITTVPSVTSFKIVNPFSRMKEGKLVLHGLVEKYSDKKNMNSRFPALPFISCSGGSRAII